MVRFILVLLSAAVSLAATAGLAWFMVGRQRAAAVGAADERPSRPEFELLMQ